MGLPCFVDNSNVYDDHEHHRFEEVKSCFGGVMLYKNDDTRLLGGPDEEPQCRYTLTRDIFWTQYNNSLNLTNASLMATTSFAYSYEWWLKERHHNEYSEQSKLELSLFLRQYVELLQVFDKFVVNRELIPKDGDICEHIPFHYCLWDKGWKFAISSRAKLYYDKFYPINRNDTNWPHYIENRAQFTT